MRAVLAPFSWFFSVLIGWRSRFYRWNLLQTQRLNKPVISVGNMTVGGTGKTPFVDILISQLEAKSLKVGVLTRGYGRKGKGNVLVNEKSSPEEVGDEPVWLYKRHPNAKIAVGPNRISASRLIADVDIIVLDDGFQHCQIQRDLDVVLLDASVPSWHYRLLPWGLAREKWNALRRSDMVVLTRVNQAPESQIEVLADGVFREGVLEVLEGAQVFERCASLRNGQDMDIKGKKVALVSGIGNSRSFEWIVKGEGAEILFHEDLDDHVEYNPVMLKSFVDKAVKKGAELLLITEKDAVKWRPIEESLSGPFPVGVVSVKMTFNPQLPDFYDLVLYNSH